MDGRIEKIRQHFDRMAEQREKWWKRNRYYHEDHIRYFHHLVGANKRVLEIGCGDGRLLAALNPTVGLGIDISHAMIARASANYPQWRFLQSDANDLSALTPEHFDYIILSDLVGYLDDVQAFLDTLHRFSHPGTRVIISYYNFLWEPALKIGERLRLKMTTPEQSWLSLDDLRNLLTLSDFQVVKTERRLLMPIYVPIVSWLLNRLGSLPLINKACLTHYVVARPTDQKGLGRLSTTVVIPCRNEKGNIEQAITRMPRFTDDIEIIFVDGHSSDGTVQEIERVKTLYPQWDIKLMAQQGSGKGDAVRLGFKHARGDVLMILDADLTVPPEDLPKFYNAIASGRAEFLNGCRLIYPMEDDAMRTLNLLANKFFALAFSWLLGQRLKDTLCGTKVLLRKNYEVLVANRSYFGDFDPFGDFDLLFGASKLNLKIAEVPVRYRNRTYGETKIHRFRHGLLLLRMVLYAYRKLKSV